ncbi:MAG: hypothetical protein EPN36_06400 [Rhodanobacteraceae bacterium]|nr:MAG: hypothetical protein EPN36_06400 [Rhodanobacteraceae bacterium]
MKLRTISIAILLVGMTGVAVAGNSTHLMQPVTVSAAGISACTPPNGGTGHACDAYDQMLRANFTPRQLGMLFGDQTSYPEYLSGGIERLQKRYDALVQQYLAAQRRAANETSVASAK